MPEVDHAKSSNQVKSPNMDGFAYSRILIKWAQEQLRSELKGLTVRKIDVAKYLGVKGSMISKVERGQRQFSTKLLTAFAKKRKQKLNELLDELITWARDRSEQSESRTRGSSTKQKQKQMIWDNQGSDDSPVTITRANPAMNVRLNATTSYKTTLVNVTDRMMAYLRESINRSRNNPEDVAYRFDGDLAFRFLLSEFGKVYDTIVPGRLVKAAIVFTSDNDHSNPPHAQYVYYDKNTKQWETRHVRKIHSSVDNDIQKAWVPSGNDTVFHSSWAPSDLREDLLSSPVAEKVKSSNIADTQTFGMRVILPIHQQQLPFSPEGSIMTTRTTLVLQFQISDSDSHLDDRERIEYISNRFSEIAEFICLAIIQDIVTTNVFTSRDLCVSATQLGSWGVAPSIEYAEAGIASILEWLFDANRIKGTKTTRTNSPTARGYDQLLAADVWFFDNWKWEFISNPDHKLHKVSDRIGTSTLVTPSRGTAGSPVPYKDYYEKYFSLLNPRVPDGKSVDCLSTGQIVVFDSSSDYIQPHREVEDLHIGTQVGIPFDVTVDESAYGVIRPAILWMRFARKLDLEESTAVITSVTRYIETCKNLRSRLRRQSEPASSKVIEANIVRDLPLCIK